MIVISQHQDQEQIGGLLARGDERMCIEGLEKIACDEMEVASHELRNCEYVLSLGLEIFLGDRCRLFLHVKLLFFGSSSLRKSIS